MSVLHRCNISHLLNDGHYKVVLYARIHWRLCVFINNSLADSTSVFIMQHSGVPGKFVNIVRCFE